MKRLHTLHLMIATAIAAYWLYQQAVKRLAQHLIDGAFKQETDFAFENSAAGAEQIDETVPANNPQDIPSIDGGTADLPRWAGGKR
jgi:hypothetical protein